MWCELRAHRSSSSWLTPLPAHTPTPTRTHNTHSRSELAWERPQTPLGTPPPGRAYAGMALLPIGTWLLDGSRVPSNSLLIFGGTGPASTFADIALLTFTPCPALNVGANTAGMAGMTCSAGGTICSYSCLLGFKSQNPSGMATCNPDGTWAAIQPLCGADPAAPGLLPGAPTLFAPAVAAVGAATALNFTLQPSVQPGFNGPTMYTVAAVPEYWMERFAGQPLDTNTYTVGALPPGSPVNNQYNIEATGYLVLGTAPSGACKLNQQDCQIIHRAFPTGDALPPVSGAWTVQAGVSFDYSTANAPNTGNQIGLGIFDTATPINVTNWINATFPMVPVTGALHFFTGMKVSATSTHQGGWESVNAAAPASFYNGATQLVSNGLTGTPAGEFRIDRWPDELVQTGVNVSRPGYGSWRFGSRFSDMWPWSWSSWMSDDKLMRVQADGTRRFNPATARIAFVGVATGATYRSWGEVKYVRFGALVADPPGPVLQVPATVTSPASTQLVPTGLVYTPGASLQFRAAATGQLGLGGFGTPTAPVTIPFSPTAAWNSSALIEVARLKPTGGVDAGGVLPTGGTVAANYASSRGVDGVIDVPLVTSTPGFVNFATHTQGSWWYVDLLIPTAVKEVALYNRFDANYAALDAFHVILAKDLYSGAATTLNGGPPVG